MSQQALQESIWEWNKKMRIDIPWNIRVRGDDCPLCQENYTRRYLRDGWEMSCGNCEIAVDTGYSACKGTPWMEASVALGRWSEARSRHGRHSFAAFEARAKWNRAGYKMIHYMESLLR